MDTLISMATKMAACSLAAVVLGWLLIGTPPASIVAYAAVASVAYILAMVGIAMLATLSWGFGEGILLALIFVAATWVMGGALYAASGLAEDHQPTAVDFPSDLLTHPVGMLFLWVLALITPLVAYFRWLDVELATQGEANG